jgi:PAS domain S-box-containing protein
MYSPIKLKAAVVAGSVSVLTGKLVVIGWLFHITVFETVIQNGTSMKFNTAISFILLGIALLLTQVQINKYYSAAFVTLSFFVTVIGFITLSEDLLHFNSGFDQLFITDTVSIAQKSLYPGRMSANTAVCFVLFGLAFLGFSAKNSFIHVISQYLLNLVTAISAVAIIGYLYGLSLFYDLNYIGSMAVHTAILFFFLSFTASLLHPELGITGLFTGKLVGNVMATRLFMAAVFVVVVFGALRIATHKYHEFSLKEGIEILIICFLCAGLALLWYMVNWLNKLDKSRYKAEKEVKVINEELEKRVEERSAKLLTLLSKLKQSELKFRAAFQHSAIGMALISLKGKWLKVNKSFCDMVGYKERELLTMSFRDLTHRDDLDFHINVMDEALNDKQEAFRVEKRYVCKNGSIVWVSINLATVMDNKGGPLYFVGQFENITERKKAEKELKAAYRQIKNHIGMIQDMTWRQSHVMRSPLANLKGLATLLQLDPSNNETLEFIHHELDKLDKIIIGMAEAAAGEGIIQIEARKRSFKLVV